jgi:uncharacterized membrane protein
MWDLYLTVQITRFVSAVIISIVVGVVASTLLAALAWRSGYNADLVFNAIGITATLLAFAGCWRIQVMS